MTDIPAALVEKAAMAWHDCTCSEGTDCRDRALHGDPRSVPVTLYLRAVLAAVWPDVAAARPVVDRDALAKALCRFWDEDLVENDASSHSYGAPFPCPPCTAEADAILASGVVVDAADVRRQTAEDIAAAIEADAEKRRPQTFWRKVRAGAAGPSDPNRWFWEGHMHAARVAREVGGDRG